MPSIDGRKTTQDFYSHTDNKRIYCHKEKNLYVVGMNGTSQHKGGLSKEAAEVEISRMQNLKGFY